MRYTREHGCRAWLTYGLMSADTIAALLEEYGCAEAIYDQFLKQGSQAVKKRLTPEAVERLKAQAEPDAMHRMMLTMQRLQTGILGMDDAQYPESLRNIPSPPALLFYRGDPDCLLGKCITVVGSRRASPRGTEITHDICRDLSAAGVTIVSGLAVGIDTAAHQGCIDGGSPTAAVLATGMDVDYPSANVDLKESIVANGGILLSEYPFGAQSNRYVFRVRNRIMSGLSRATLMMESRIRSGSFLTVQHALDQGRDVYAYPGILGTEWAEGAHQLLREGASYFTGAADILEDLGWDDDAPAIRQKAPEQQLPPLSPEQRAVYSALSKGESSFDELAESTGIEAPSLSVALTMLQMMGLIKALPGKCYCKV